MQKKLYVIARQFTLHDKVKKLDWVMIEMLDATLW